MKEKMQKKSMSYQQKRADRGKTRTEKKLPSLKTFGELRLIQEIKKHYSGFERRINNIGIGDDCAVIRTQAKREILVTTDSQMEEIHFASNQMIPEHIGERSVAITLSDIAAMGGRPEYIFLNLGIPEKINAQVALRIMSGIHEACNKYKVSLLGGDTVKSKRGLIICLTAIGSVTKAKAVLRCGAKITDGIFLTGTVGGSALGLEMLKKGHKLGGYGAKRNNILEKDRFHTREVIRRHVRPIPHLEEGAFFSKEQIATAMIDVSDGLSADLYNLCQASKVGAKIYESLIPFDPALLHIVNNRRKVLRMALSGGEDYCLLLTISKKNIKQAMKKFQNRFSRPLYRIGEIISENLGFRLVSKNGTVKALPRMGYEHFRNPFPH